MMQKTRNAPPPFSDMRETRAMRGFLTTRDEPGLAELATRQHGVVSLAQLQAAGLSADAVGRRVKRGLLHRIHRGVYAVGHRRIGARGHLWAAVLAVPGSVLSHRSAAAAWDLCPTPSGRLDVTTQGGARSTKAIRVHRTTNLEATTQEDGLPTTTIARTLQDLAATETQHRLQRLTARAEHLRLLDTTTLTSPTDKRGAPRLEAALEAIKANGAEVTRSELEERFLELIAREALPRPGVNQTIEGYEVDFVWRAQRLIVETDGAETHLTHRAFETDRARDAVLVSGGWRVVRFTWRQVTDGSAAETLRRLLA